MVSYHSARFSRALALRLPFSLSSRRSEDPGGLKWTRTTRQFAIFALLAFAPIACCSLGFRLASSATGSASAPPLTLFTRACPAASLFPYLPAARKILVGSSGLEPPTSRLSGVRSNQLSYEPIPSIPALLIRFLPRFLRFRKKLVEMNGFEPMTPCLQSRCSPS